MAEEGNITTSLPNGEDTGPSVGFISQYVKDLSVENPNAPASYQWQDAPQLEVQFGISANQLDGEVHEVELKVSVAAKADAGTAYMVELAFGALIGMRGLPPEQAHAFLFAEAPRLMFPFARRIISDAVRDAGYAPVMLEPIDFNGLYLQQLTQAVAETEPLGNA